MENASLSQSELLERLNGYFEQEFENLIARIVAITKIPSPSFQEDGKADYIINLLSSMSKLDISKDEFKNVIIRYPGKVRTAKLAILAHIDTVFSLETPLTVEKKDGGLIGPSVGDNSASVAVMLHILSSWYKNDFIPEFDILFVANSCEEGLGDLKGVKGLLDSYCKKNENNVDLKALLSLDGTIDRVTHIAIGVKRYKLEITTSGGHSWGDFGIESAIHILGRIISDISHISVPSTPKTTYNVGVIEGGTSVNTIAGHASAFIDLRSVSEEELKKLDLQIHGIIEKHTSHKKEIHTKIILVGDRPSGVINADHKLVTIVKKSAKDVGLEKIPLSGMASTDANIPLSRGIPAVAFGCYAGYGAHTKNETVLINSLKKGVPYANLSILRTIDWINKN